MDDTKCIIFTGPSLSCAEVKEYSNNVQCWPPVRRGDVKKALQSNAQIIGIIDGVFYNKAAVSHKEILEALRSGVIVIGGSSMGALRAYELDKFGMIGVGQIYHCFKAGIIEADDEVAVAFNPITYQPVSVPLINIRALLKSLVTANVITSQQHDELLTISKNLFYPDRRPETIFERALRDGIIGIEVIKDIEKAVKDVKYDLKKKDAVAVIRKVLEMKD